jgi:hypothetical protein
MSAKCTIYERYWQVLNYVWLTKQHYRIVLFLACRFVSPFLSVVRKWEKTLCIVSEVVDEWLAVQHKWLHLEGIFSGGDIRQQLPDEATKFDDIDNGFCKVLSI